LPWAIVFRPFGAQGHQAAAAPNCRQAPRFRTRRFHRRSDSPPTPKVGRVARTGSLDIQLREASETSRGLSAKSDRLLGPLQSRLDAMPLSTSGACRPHATTPHPPPGPNLSGPSRGNQHEDLRHSMDPGIPPRGRRDARAPVDPRPSTSGPRTHRCTHRRPRLRRR
jgi:hypothetical protein